MDKQGNFSVLSDTSWLEEMERRCGIPFVYEQLRQIQSQLRQELLNDTKENK